MSEAFCEEQLAQFLEEVAGSKTSADLITLIEKSRNDYFWTASSVESIIEKSKGLPVVEQRKVAGHLLNHLQCTLLRGAGEEHKTLYRALHEKIVEYAKTL